jgi:translation elongation factor P/translation initiation factor 5A
MENELLQILNDSKKQLFYCKYFYLSSSLYIKNKNIINILIKYISESNTKIKIYYNSITESFDSINIIDTHQFRIIDLDDNMYSMMNKGIYKQIELKIEF